MAASNKSNTPVTAALKQVLADSYVLYLKTQNHHWNITGPHFKPLHEMFGAQYAELAAAIDEIAERIRALGEPAPGSFKAFAALTTLAEAGEGIVTAPAGVKQLAADHAAVTATLNKALAISEKAGDEATSDILITRIAAHDKHRWMLESSL